VSTRLARTTFACAECGHESLKWLGRCPGCASWNTFAEVLPAPRSAATARREGPRTEPVELSSLSGADEPRLSSGLPEFDRVLGGGIVAGSLVLVGGDPGIGKSTLLLQVAAGIASGREACPEPDRRALYVSGEGLFALPETNLEEVFRRADSLAPAALIVDSIQTVYTEAAGQAPGSVAQLRQSALELMRWGKTTGIPVFIIGHVTKDGDIAGPRLLEHIVDVVLYLEGERFSSYRLLRGVKNRFGSVDEIGVFEMTGEGMQAVENPSQAFIAERARDAVGSAIVATLEGSRPMLVEVQALTSPTVTPAPRRTANGLDVNRLILVSAVLSRRLSLPLASQDIIASVVGGLRVREPAADLGLALAIVSSQRDKPIAGDIIALGEIGLSGELRSVSQLDRRLAEAERLGFTRAIVPGSNAKGGPLRAGINVMPAPTVRDAVRLALA
ncbi:MAG: DNA repair protein RadA, partial [Chloroflexi bacterium]